jgi:hypothetical protein
MTTYAKQQIAETVRHGETIETVARDHGISEATVERIVKTVKPSRCPNCRGLVYQPCVLCEGAQL